MRQIDIYKLHKKYSNEKKILEIVWTHSLIVKDIALQIASNLEKKYKIKVNKKLLVQGSLVHDIGCYDCLGNNFCFGKNYITHGEIGYKILLENKYPESIARFSLVHIGVGVEDMIPITLEEEIVAYADNFHSKKPVRFNNYEGEKEKLEGFDQSKGIIFERFKDKFGIPNLEELKEKYKNWQEEINKWIDSVK
jgi:uncharacterized protein